MGIVGEFAWIEFIISVPTLFSKGNNLLDHIPHLSQNFATENSYATFPSIFSFYRVFVIIFHLTLFLLVRY
jgi:hypothetical protein